MLRIDISKLLIIQTYFFGHLFAVLICDLCFLEFPNQKESDVILSQEDAMMIRIMYDDGRFDMVKPQMLDTLLETNRITSFKRNAGWAVIGRDTIRGNRRSQSYQGLERRVC